MLRADDMDEDKLEDMHGYEGRLCQVASKHRGDKSGTYFLKYNPAIFTINTSPLLSTVFNKVTYFKENKHVTALRIISMVRVN